MQVKQRTGRSTENIAVIEILIIILFIYHHLYIFFKPHCGKIYWPTPFQDQINTITFDYFDEVY